MLDQLVGIFQQLMCLFACLLQYLHFGTLYFIDHLLIFDDHLIKKIISDMKLARPLCNILLLLFQSLQLTFKIELASSYQL